MMLNRQCIFELSAWSGNEVAVLTGNAPSSGVFSLTPPLAGLALAAGFFGALMSAHAEDFPSRLNQSGGAGDLVAIAKRDIGKTGPQLGLSSYLWCAKAINQWRGRAGLHVVPSGKAADQTRHATRISAPVPGALMITRRRGGAHVDLIAIVHDDGTVSVIRPNWSKRVRMERVKPHGAIYMPV